MKEPSVHKETNIFVNEEGRLDLLFLAAAALSVEILTMMAYIYYM